MLSEKTIEISGCMSRQEIRKKLILTFLEEEPGFGTGSNASQYKYYAETLSDGRHVFLWRPAMLNKGLDFVVNVEDYTFYSDKICPNGKYRKLPAPAHHNIISDLRDKKRENPLKYDKLKCEIRKIFEIQPYNKQPASFTGGMPVEMLLAVIKWLFIEQDVTYWNFSGRSMLMERIEAI